MAVLKNVPIDLLPSQHQQNTPFQMKIGSKRGDFHLFLASQISGFLLAFFLVLVPRFPGAVPRIIT